MKKGWKALAAMLLALMLPLGALADAAAPDAFLTVDGQEGIPLCGGDVIRVQSLDAGLRVLSCSSGTYFQRLRERGFIQTDGTSAPEHV